MSRPVADEDFVEAVLSLVERIPAGRVMTYGAIAEYLGRGGPRQVGTVMARHGGPVPWHRVCTAAGRVPPGCEAEALRRLRSEGTPARGEGVDVRAAAWWPDDDPDDIRLGSPDVAATARLDRR
jgi:methylated-DNA-protein-cysteine methyltransferase related protein